MCIGSIIMQFSKPSVCVCVYVCMYVCIYIYIYIYIYNVVVVGDCC